MPESLLERRWTQWILTTLVKDSVNLCFLDLLSILWMTNDMVRGSPLLPTSLKKTLLINYWRNQMWLRILPNTALQAATDSLQSRWMSLKLSFIFMCGDHGYICPWLQDLSTKQCTTPNQHPGCDSFPRTRCWTRLMYSFGSHTCSSFNVYNRMDHLISLSVTSDSHG